MSEDSILPENKRFCACGCGRVIAKVDKRRREHWYIWGHGKRGRHFPNINQTGSHNSNWKGGRFVDKDGYVKIRFLGQYVCEHILVMEKHLGRAIMKDEEVHHVNHNRQDNRIENLMLFTRTKHKQLHSNERNRNVEGQFI
jgi:hypothetical protein